MDSVPCKNEFADLQTFPALATSMKFLNYAPPARALGTTYTNFLDELGFEAENEAAAGNPVNTRLAFISDLRDHVDSSYSKYLRKRDNEKAFEKMIEDFLSKHGAIYWGPSQRDHLTEKNPLKGFLYPRDAERKDSRLTDVLENMFHYKADFARRNDKRKNNDEQVLKHIDFAAFGKITTDPLPTPKPKKRRTCLTVITDGSEDSDYETSGLSGNNTKRSDRLAAQALWNHEFNFRGNRKFSRSGENQKVNYEDPPTPDSEEPSAGISPLRNHSSVLSSHIHSDKLEQSGSRPSLPNRLPKPVNLGNRSRRGNKPSMLSGNRGFVGKNTYLEGSSLTPKDCTATASTTLKPDDDDDDCVILEDMSTNSAQRSVVPEMRIPAPYLAVKTGSTVKDEQNDVSVKTEQLSSNSMARTSFIVTASNQSTIAPVIVPFTSCNTFGRLFETLISECDVHPEAAGRVSKISARNTWDGKQVRIRKGRPEDWDYFCRGLYWAWKQEKERFEHGYEIEMMIHVDN